MESLTLQDINDGDYFTIRTDGVCRDYQKLSDVTPRPKNIPKYATPALDMKAHTVIYFPYGKEISRLVQLAYLEKYTRFKYQGVWFIILGHNGQKGLTTVCKLPKTLDSQDGIDEWFFSVDMLIPADSIRPSDYEDDYEE